jgi:hypothetical protein
MTTQHYSFTTSLKFGISTVESKVSHNTTPSDCSAFSSSSKYPSFTNQSVRQNSKNTEEMKLYKFGPSMSKEKKHLLLPAEGYST